MSLLELIDLVFDRSIIPTFVTSSRGAFRLVNPAFAALVGRDADALVGGDVTSVLEVDAGAGTRGASGSAPISDVEVGVVTRSDGATSTCLVTAAVLEPRPVDEDEPLVLRQVVFVDDAPAPPIGPARSSGQTGPSRGDDRDRTPPSGVAVAAPTARVLSGVIADSLRDDVTGAWTRSVVLARLDDAMEELRAARSSGVGLAVVDLDHLKAINDAFGHLFGDEVMRAVVDRITDQLRDVDSVGRLGGDEFLVVLNDVGAASAIDAVVERLDRALNPMAVELADGHSVSVTTSVGLAWTVRPVAPRDLLREADAALLDAKRNGRGRIWRSTETEPAARAVERSLSRDLLTALDDDQYELHFQPIIDADGVLRGAESLLRWNHPRHGLIAPGRFLAALTTNGHIGAVGRWVIERSVATLATWDRAGFAPLRVNVNVSPTELAHPAFVEHLAAVVADAGIDPGRLVVEITEQALEGTIVAAATLERIGALGVKMVLDDFGTGVSSLTHLRTEPLDGIKIDRSFISRSKPGDIDRRIVAGVVALAHTIGVWVTAEGVEHEEQARWITSLGCERQQGYHHSRPLPAEAFASLLSHVPHGRFVVERRSAPRSGPDGSVT